MLTRVDIKSVFCLLPVHTADLHLLGMKWRGSVYNDHYIPFGFRSAPKLFNVLGDLLAWIMGNTGVSYLIHHLDNYWTIGPLCFTVCQQNTDKFVSLCAELGVPLASDKLEGTSMSLTFLGITEHMEIGYLQTN